MREAAYLTERPAGGWDSLATKEHVDLRFQALDHRFEALEQRMLREIDRRSRMQTTFLVSAMIAAFGLFGLLAR